MAYCRLLFRVAGALLGLAFFALAADPDFSGAWRLNEQKSEIRNLPAGPEKELWIEQSGVGIRVGKPPAVRAMTTDGKEAKIKIGDAEERSILKWEGAALLINTLVKSPASSYTRMERWKLSRDGRTLSIRRQIVSLHGETESTLLYEKQ